MIIDYRLELMMDNLQTAMMDAEWARRADERRRYRVLRPAAPGAVSYHMAMALVADRAGLDDLVQAILDAAEQAAVAPEIERMQQHDARAVLVQLKGILARARNVGASAEDAALKAERLIDDFLGGV